MCFAGDTPARAWDPEQTVLRLRLDLIHFMMARSVEMFTAVSVVVHSVHCLTRGDVVLYSNDKLLEYARWNQANQVEGLFKGHACDMEQMEWVRVRTRNSVRGHLVGPTAMPWPFCWS